MDPKDFRKMGHEMVECIAKYMETIHDMPVVPDVRPGFLLKQLPSSAPEEGQPWEDIYTDVNKLILPGVSHICMSTWTKTSKHCWILTTETCKCAFSKETFVFWYQATFYPAII